ncbi:MAG: hypothetical protein ACTXOO_01505 [Sodalis sp. (in: enterobacteria)]
MASAGEAALEEHVKIVLSALKSWLLKTLREEQGGKISYRRPLSALTRATSYKAFKNKDIDESFVEYSTKSVVKSLAEIL